MSEKDTRFTTYLYSRVSGIDLGRAWAIAWRVAVMLVWFFVIGAAFVVPVWVFDLHWLVGCAIGLLVIGVSLVMVEYLNWRKDASLDAGE